MWEQSVLWEGYSRRSNLYRHTRAHIHACLRHILVLIPDVIGTDGILAGSRVGDFSRRGHPPSGRCTTSPGQQQLMRRPRHLAGLRLSGGFGATSTPLRRFTYSSNPSWLALSDGRGLYALDAVVFGCGRRLLYRHGMDKQSRAASLPRALRRSSWSSGAWSPTLTDGRGLSTADTAALAVVDDSSPSFGGAAIVWWLWLPQCASGVFSHRRATLRGSLYRMDVGFTLSTL